MSAAAVPASRDGARPEISFLVAAHDAAPFVAEAIRSALAQRDCLIEVIVVDDASSDDTATLVDSLSKEDSRVRLIRRTSCAGAAAARNAAIENAVGDWLAVLDADDVILPGRGRAMLQAAAATSADIVADNLTRFGDGVPQEVAVLRSGPLPYSFTVDTASYLTANRLLRRGLNLGYLKPMFRRSFVDRHGLRYDESLRIGEDSHLCLEALLAGARFLVLSEAFYRYRVRSGSLSWRLARVDIDAMKAAFAPLRSRLEVLDRTTSRASHAYCGALDRARSIVTVLEAAKGGLIGSALAEAFRRPQTWGFLGSVGLSLLGRRLTRRSGRLRSAST